MRLTLFEKNFLDGNYQKGNRGFIQTILANMPNYVKEVSEFLKLDKNQILVTKSEPVQYAFITLSGEITVVNEFESGKIFEPVVISHSDFTCVVEIILNMKEIIATNMTKTDVECIKIPKEAFKRWMDHNHEITKLVLHSVSDNFMKNMVVSGENILLDTMYLFIRHLLNSAIYDKQERKYTLHETREKTSMRTGINLRTLYRHIKSLKEKRFLDIYKRNIAYTESQREQLLDYVYYLRNK